MRVYLDHHATTPCDPAVLDAMWPWFAERFGNPSSRSHAWGHEARAAVEDARAKVAARIGASAREIAFTSGATEADNLAILGALRANRARGDHAVTVATEHAAVLDAMKQAEREGFRVTVLPVDARGLVDPDAFEAALGPRTVLASVMWANNEIGVLQPIADLARRASARGVLFHTDAAQALLTERIDVRSLPIDLMSLSAHKAHGPKGVGALWVRRGRPKVELQALMYGGGHERGLRPGTLPVPLIVGFGAAAERYDPGEVELIRRRRDRLEAALLGVGGVRVTAGDAPRSANNLHVLIDGVESEALMVGCREIGMSSGSACSSESLSPSHVLRALGLDRAVAATAVRLGLGRFVDDAQVEHAATRLTSKILELRALEAR